jgi:hypothetical protein
MRQICWDVDDYIFYSFEASIKQFETQSNQGCTAKIMSQLGKMPQQVNPFVGL